MLALFSYAFALLLKNAQNNASLILNVEMPTRLVMYPCPSSYSIPVPAFRCRHIVCSRRHRRVFGRRRRKFGPYNSVPIWSWENLPFIYQTKSKNIFSDPCQWSILHKKIDNEIKCVNNDCQNGHLGGQQSFAVQQSEESMNIL